MDMYIHTYIHTYRTFYFSNGKVYEGEWFENVRHGTGMEREVCMCVCVCVCVCMYMGDSGLRM
jgi:hypothetical protein